MYVKQLNYLKTLYKFQVERKLDLVNSKYYQTFKKKVLKYYQAVICKITSRGTKRRKFIV